MTTSAVKAQDLFVERRGKEVLHGLTFTVPAGRITGLLGPSGGGKSTLLRSVVGVQAGVRGTLTVLGRPAGDADLTVRRNLQYFAEVVGAADRRVDEVLADVDLTHAAAARVDRLSGGQQARVSLATALLAEPELLVLDEPTVGLDPVLRRDLWRLFRSLAEASPVPGIVVFGSMPITRPRPYHGASRVPPSSYQSQAQGKREPSQDSAAAMLLSRRRMAAQGWVKSSRYATAARGPAGRERSMDPAFPSTFGQLPVAPGRSGLAEGS